MTNKELYKYRKENGICVYCGKLREEDRKNRVACASCNNKQVEYTNETRRFRTSYGICPRCGKNKLFGSERNCPECRAIHANRAENYRKKNKDKISKNNKLSYIKRTNFYRENGLCTKCGSKVLDNFKLCFRCREQARLYKQKESIKKNKMDFTIRIDKGICLFCNNPVKDKYKVCDVHYEDCLKKLNDCKDKRMEALQNSYWKKDEEVRYAYIRYKQNYS